MLGIMKAHKIYGSLQLRGWSGWRMTWGNMSQKVYRKAPSGTGAVVLPMALHVILDAYKS